MRKDVLYILIGAAVLVVIGVIGIVLLDTQFSSVNFNTGFGLIPEEIFGLPIGWVASAVLLVIALILFYVFVWSKKSNTG